MPETSTMRAPDMTESTPEQNETRLDDKVHYVFEKYCPGCRKDYTISVLKNSVSNRREAADQIKDKIYCGACQNKDKIAAAAKQMKEQM